MGPSKKAQRIQQSPQLRESSAPLTRSSIPPIYQFLNSAPMWLYSAILGNGHLLICLDETGSIAQLFYPYIDSGPHVRSFLAGLQISKVDGASIEGNGPESISNEDIQDEKDVSWFVDENWVHDLSYLDRAPVAYCISTNDAAQIRVERLMAVHPDLDVCTIEIKVTNYGTMPVDCKLITYAGFSIDHRQSANTCFFDSESSLLTFFAYDRYISVGCTGAVEGFACDKASIGEPDRVFQDVSVGKFSGREYAIGQVSGAVCHDFGRIEANNTSVRYMNVYCGRTLEDVVALSKSVKERQSSIQETMAWWRMQYADTQLESASASVKDVYSRSLVTLRLLTDAGTGGIIAAPECDPDFRASGGYGLCWPRDGAFIGHALDMAGQYDHARTFYDWALHVQSKSGVWYQRYYVNGQLGSTWGLVQFDETGAVVWAICRHVQLTGDIAYGRKVFSQLLRACIYMQAMLDPEMGLAPLTKDLWEERDGINTYACASTWAGFHEFSELALKLGESVEAERWASAALKLKGAIETHLWDASLGRFLRGINTKISAHDVERLSERSGFSTADILETEFVGKPRYFRRKDSTVDASILGLSVPFGVFSPDDPRMLATAEAISSYLVSAVGGIRRYEDDSYRGGNPWVICTLWLALQCLASGQKERASELYGWVLEHRTQLDLLPEQVDRTTGKPCWVVPLGWSHAMFILITQALAEQGLLPQ